MQSGKMEKKLRNTASSNVVSWVQHGQLAELLDMLLSKYASIKGFLPQYTDKTPTLTAFKHRVYEKSFQLLQEYKKNNHNQPSDPVLDAHEEVIAATKDQSHIQAIEIEKHLAKYNPNLSDFNV
jgi:hypothetical protein